MRAIRAQERLDFQRDINAGLMPGPHKMWKLYLAEIAHDDYQSDAYRREVETIADLPSLKE